MLSVAAYARLGGLDGAIATHAETLVSALPDAAQEALPGVLLGLVSIREGEQQPTMRAALQRDARCERVLNLAPPRGQICAGSEPPARRSPRPPRA